jgi:hypothetical protein
MGVDGRCWTSARRGDRSIVGAIVALGGAREEWETGQAFGGGDVCSTGQRVQGGGGARSERTARAGGGDVLGGVERLERKGSTCSPNICVYSHLPPRQMQASCPRLGPRRWPVDAAAGGQLQATDAGDGRDDAGSPSSRVVHRLGCTLSRCRLRWSTSTVGTKGGCEVLTKQWALVDNTDGELSPPSHPLASTPRHPLLVASHDEQRQQQQQPTTPADRTSGAHQQSQSQPPRQRQRQRREQQTRRAPARRRPPPHGQIPPLFVVVDVLPILS